MDSFSVIQWEHPEVLWGLAALPVLGFLLWYDRLLKRRLIRQWSQVPGVVGRSALPTRWGNLQRAVLLLSSFALAVAGFASPTLPSVVWEPSWKRVAVGLLLDVSSSMRALADPRDSAGMSRLDTLKQAVQELLGQLPGGVRVGVIAFAGVAVPIVPEPSADHQAVMAKIRRLDQTFIANPGTNLSAAIQQALTLFVDPTLDAQPDTVSLILLSDGDTTVTQDLQTVLRQATRPIFTLGIGTPWPVRIPDPDSVSGFLVDRHGHLVTTAVNESVLRRIAGQTGGLYSLVTRREPLVRMLQQIVSQQGRQVAQPIARPRPVRQACFLAALCGVFLYQFQTRTRHVSQRRGVKHTTLV
jgi:Ca-activated chloride channel family protein